MDLRLELRAGAEVYTPRNEQLGTLNGIVLNPATKEVTHLVISKGGLFQEDKVVPFDMVSTATEDKVVLKNNVNDIDELAPFEESHFIRTPEGDVSRGRNPRGQAGELQSGNVESGTSTIDADVSRGRSLRYGTVPAYYWYPPRGYIGHPIGYYGWPLIEKTRNIPHGSFPLREGTNVISDDGEHVGDIERLFVEPDTNRVTHFAISQGVLFKDRKLVPVHWVRSVEEDKVTLIVSSKVLEDLPSHED